MRIGFVGAGNMATGLARGWKSAEGEPGAPEAMLFSDADSERARAAAEEVGGEAVEGNRAVAEAADLVVLAVKPNVLDAVAGEVSEAGKPVLSILAGTTLERLAEALPGAALIRVMPNLGAQLRQAVLCVAYGDGVDPGLRKQAGEALALLGEVIELDEDLIDPATAIMGCAPGYLALMAEALVEAGKGAGLTGEQAQAMAAKAMSATGGLLEVRDPAELKRAVASPGGMTEAGLEALEERDFREALQAAVDASLARVRG
jgi:pyrroline-5-carboxylate reductase